MGDTLSQGCGHDHSLDNHSSDFHDIQDTHEDINFSTPQDLVDITLSHAGKTWTLNLPPSATVEDIALLCENELSSSSAGSTEEFETTGTTETTNRYSVTKLIAPPPVGLLHIDNQAHAALTIADLQRRLTKKASTATPAAIKLRVMASSVSSVAALKLWSATAKARVQRLQDLRRRAVPARATQRFGGDDNGGFTFGDIKPLPHLPQPERALAYLHRLRDDVGIRRVMRAHEYRVGLLTEMDPQQYTQESMDGVTRVLGLNRNKGQVIELRLRTDAGGGYRDYKTVRLTLCHELAHNVFSEHDKHFWALYRQLVQEVGAADYIGNGGRVLLDGGRENQYAPERPDDEDEAEGDIGHVDGGGWTGGTFVLGSGPTVGSGPGSASATQSSTSTSASTTSSPLTERERRARAAEERLRRMGGGASGPDSSSTN
ncbi:zinc metalloproteinase [Ophiostoma piceae UAMH 11346]|uniref:Zinc metalloproteinase n=1 Tax=Ophiostoma piceae (strain UAMH 11346) TaxID=1262450 RepID=S3D1I5_OPHP1|nr:zinc metalloproteinase [Ophiostoma piceae UAMH 11346]